MLPSAISNIGDPRTHWIWSPKNLVEVHGLDSEPTTIASLIKFLRLTVRLMPQAWFLPVSPLRCAASTSQFMKKRKSAIHDKVQNEVQDQT